MLEALQLLLEVLLTAVKYTGGERGAAHLGGMERAAPGPGLAQQVMRYR